MLFVLLLVCCTKIYVPYILAYRMMWHITPDFQLKLKFLAIFPRKDNYKMIFITNIYADLECYLCY
jgi:hypothetical protein